MAKKGTINTRESISFLTKAAAYTVNQSGMTTSKTPGTGQDNGWYEAMVARVVDVMTALLLSKYSSTYWRVRLDGKMDGDYHRSSSDFPLFLSDVASELKTSNPPYQLTDKNIADLAKKYISATALTVCGAIESILVKQNSG